MPREEIRSDRSTNPAGSEFFNTLQEMRRDWMACATAEVELSLKLSKKLTDAHSVPDAVAAYQEWLNDEMGAEDARLLMSNGQKFMDTTSRIPVNANDQRLAPQRELNGSPVTPPARRTVNATKPEPARKPIDNAASTAASPPDQSFVSQVRAALTNVDANRTDPHEVSPHQSPAVAQPQSGTATPSAVAPVAAVPRQQSPIEFNPPVPVEIKSRPVVDAQSAPATSAGQDTGVLSPLEQMLRVQLNVGVQNLCRVHFGIISRFAPTGRVFDTDQCVPAAGN